MIKQNDFYYNGEVISPKVLMSEESVEYQKKRNKLIPVAVFFADQKHGHGHKIKDCDAWNRTFFQKMDELWRDSQTKVVLEPTVANSSIPTAPKI